MQGKRARAGARGARGRQLGRARLLPSRWMQGKRTRAGARGARGRPLGRARRLPSRRMLGKRARTGARGAQGRAAWEGEVPAEPQDAGQAYPSWCSGGPGAGHGCLLCWDRTVALPCSTHRGLLDQRKIVCAPAGCSLMGSAKNARDTASVRGKKRSDANDDTRRLASG